MVLDEGNIVMAGTPDEILSKEEVAQYSFDMDEEIVEETMKVCKSLLKVQVQGW